MQKCVTLEEFIDQSMSGEREPALIVKGRVKWQKALTSGIKKARAAEWNKKAAKTDRDRVREMAGDWILEEPPWWTHFQRPTWMIAMRLRYGLIVTPAIGTHAAERCLAKKQDGTFCLELLDAYGRHAQVCKVEGAACQRHDTIRDGIVPALKPHVTTLKLEQFIYELAQLDENTGETQEARMDIVVESPKLRAMIDVRCFFSLLKSGWVSARAHEVEKHKRYVTTKDGRRCTNMSLYPAVVNTYGYVGEEFKDFCSVIDTKKRGIVRGKSLVVLFSLLGVYANAEKVLLAYTPTKKRAQCEAVLKAVAAIESATPAHGARKASNAEKKWHPKTRRPDIRCEVFDEKNGLRLKCSECNVTMAYGRWGRHLDDNHNENNSQDQVDDGNVEAENRPAPKKKAEPKRAAKKVATKEPKKKAKSGGK